MATYVEKGDIYFFYRPKVDTEKVQGLDDVQRMHLVLVPDDEIPLSCSWWARSACRKSSANRNPPRASG